MIDHTAENADVATLSSADITVLSGIGPQNGPAMRESMQVTTVRDLALWPPYLAAKALFQEVYNPEQAPEYDPEAPVETGCPSRACIRQNAFSTRRFCLIKSSMTHRRFGRSNPLAPSMCRSRRAPISVSKSRRSADPDAFPNLVHAGRRYWASACTASRSHREKAQKSP